MMKRTNGTALLLSAAAVALTWTVAAQSGQWAYTALGDSIATGYLAQAGYVVRYQTDLQVDNSVTVTLYNLGQNGWTSGGLLNALATNTVFQSSIQQSEVVTWDIGINDFKSARAQYKAGTCKGKDNQDCLRSAVSTFMANWDGIVTQVLTRRTTADTIIRTMDIYDPWVAVDQMANTTPDAKEAGPARGNDFQVLEYYLDQMNSHIAASATNNAIPLAGVHAAFNGANGDHDPIASGYIASDGLHPSDAGHQVIADLLRTLGYAPLR